MKGEIRNNAYLLLIPIDDQSQIAIGIDWNTGQTSHARVFTDDKGVDWIKGLSMAKAFEVIQ